MSGELKACRTSCFSGKINFLKSSIVNPGHESFLIPKFSSESAGSPARTIELHGTGFRSETVVKLDGTTGAGHARCQRHLGVLTRSSYNGAHCGVRIIPAGCCAGWRTARRTWVVRGTEGPRPCWSEVRACSDSWVAVLAYRTCCGRSLGRTVRSGASWFCAVNLLRRSLALSTAGSGEGRTRSGEMSERLMDYRTKILERTDFLNKGIPSFRARGFLPAHQGLPCGGRLRHCAAGVRKRRSPAQSVEREDRGTLSVGWMADAVHGA